MADQLAPGVVSELGLVVSVTPAGADLAPVTRAAAVLAGAAHDLSERP